MKALLDTDACSAVAIHDPSPDNTALALQMAPQATSYLSFEELLGTQPDGIVIATPSALHAQQCIMALERGIPVFCQKPLARTARESREVIEAARRNNLLLGVDLSYRFTDGMQQIYQLAHNNELGDIFAVDLEFHNAYGPDKSWFFDPTLSGGGCLIDLGIHLVDLAMWVLDFPQIEKLQSSLFSKGRLITNPENVSEDFASAQMQTADGKSIRISCSWNLSAGKDAEIKAAFYGTRASAGFNNINGSFYDFAAYINHGTSSTSISMPPDDWGGRALHAWTQRLAQDRSFNPDILHYIPVASIIDMAYGR
jgi:predicted dehydrogenase